MEPILAYARRVVARTCQRDSHEFGLVLCDPSLESSDVTRDVGDPGLNLGQLPGCPGCPVRVPGCCDLVAQFGGMLFVGGNGSGRSLMSLAIRLGTSQSAVARLEAGDVDARVSTLARYAAALGRRIEWRLVNG